MAEISEISAEISENGTHFRNFHISSEFSEFAKISDIYSYFIDISVVSDIYLEISVRFGFVTVIRFYQAFIVLKAMQKVAIYA